MFIIHYQFQYQGETFGEQGRRRNKTRFVWAPAVEKCLYCGEVWHQRSRKDEHLAQKHNSSLEQEMKEFCPVNFDDAYIAWKKFRSEEVQRSLNNGHKKTGAANKKWWASLSEEEKEQQRKFRSDCNKGVFTEAWFKKKYGDIEGERLYKERSEQISKSSGTREMTQHDGRLRYSKISQVLFNGICKKLNRTNGIYYATLNHEFSLGSHHNFDFVDTINKKVIEFNGDKWHANPKLYKENDISMKKGNCVIVAKDVWAKDKSYEELAHSKGYDLMWVWESDFNSDPERIINDCVKFITNQV